MLDVYLVNVHQKISLEGRLWPPGELNRTEVVLSAGKKACHTYWVHIYSFGSMHSETCPLCHISKCFIVTKKKKSIKKKTYLETSMKAKTTVLPEGMSFMNLHVEAHLELTDGNTCWGDVSYSTQMIHWNNIKTAPIGFVFTACQMDTSEIFSLSDLMFKRKSFQFALHNT